MEVSKYFFVYDWKIMENKLDFFPFCWTPIALPILCPRTPLRRATTKILLNKINLSNTMSDYYEYRTDPSSPNLVFSVFRVTEKTYFASQLAPKKRPRKFHSINSSYGCDGKNITYTLHITFRGELWCKVCFFRYTKNGKNPIWRAEIRSILIIVTHCDGKIDFME